MIATMLLLFQFRRLHNATLVLAGQCDLMQWWTLAMTLRAMLGYA